MLIGLYRELSGKERKKGKERHIKVSFRGTTVTSTCLKKAWPFIARG